MKNLFTRALVVALQISFAIGPAESARSTTPSPTPNPDPRAAGEAMKARESQTAAFNSATYWFNYFAGTCMTGGEASCKPYWGEACGCAWLVKQQLDGLKGSMEKTLENAQSFSSGAVDGRRSEIAAQSAKIEETFRQLTAAGFRVSADGKTMTLPGGGTAPAPNASGAPAIGGGSGSGGSGMQMASTTQGGGTGIKGTDKASPASDKGASGVASDSGSGGGQFGGGARREPIAAGKSSGSVHGMTKKLGKDLIGVTGDNIFEMISRRYQANDGN